MADIRINALATTATTPASDDYLALDGTAQGTRKILATNIANNVTDVILGSSGPSVKSTLSARAPRQGLVFDGTAGTTWAGFTPSSSDFTVAAWFSANSLAANNVIIDGTGPSSGFALYVATDGSIRRLNRNAGTTETTAAGLIVTGKRYHIAYVRGAFYLNGVSVLTFTDTQNYTAALTRIGWSAGSDSFCTGFLSVLIYNRALSASEVVALYEAGAPAGADYNSASSTSLITSAFTNYSSSYSTFSGASTSGFTAASAGGNAYAQGNPVTYAFVTGRKYRLTYTLTLNSGQAPFSEFGNLGIAGPFCAPTQLSAGTNTLELTATSSGTGNLIIKSTAATNFVLASVSLVPLGLLLAPDAAQAGGGLVWYDTSGNAANITLPASGVSWNVPSSRVLGGNWTTSGDLTVSGTGTSSFASGSLLKIGLPTNAPNKNLGGNLLQVKSAGGIAYITIGNGDGANNTSYIGGASSYLLFGKVSDAGSTTEFARFIDSGNYLLGTTTDSGNGKLQLATHTTSAGGIGFGTDISLYRPQAGVLAIDGSQAALYLRDSGTTKGRLNVTASTLYIDAVDASGSTGQIILRTGNGGGTALTLDSSQNATFAGTVTASTAGNYVLQLKDTRSQAADVGASIGLQGTYTGSLQTTFGSILGLKVNSTDGNFAGKLVFQTRPNGGSLTTALTLDDSQNAIFAGSTGVQLKNDSFLYFGSTVRTAVKGNSTGSLDLYSNNNLSLSLDSSGNLVAKLNGTAPSLGTNSTMTFELTSNTSLTIKVRGTDGTTRSVALTLA